MSQYAPEYTKKEKWILIAKQLAWAIPLLIFLKYYVLPAFRRYAENIHCYDYGFANGFQIVFYAVLIGIPISFSLIVFLTIGRRSLKVIKIKQDPLPNEKVYRKTKYRYGWRATIKHYIALFICFCMFAYGVYGIVPANKLLYKLQTEEPTLCKH